MGDMGDDFRWLREEKKKRHRACHALSMAILEKSDLVYRVTNCGESVVIEAKPGKPQVVFFPSTGRWRSKQNT